MKAIPPALFAFRKGRLIVEQGIEQVSVADLPQLGSVVATAIRSYPLACEGGVEGRAIELAADTTLPDGTTSMSLRSLFGVLSDSVVREAARASHIVEWGRRHRFCGLCGGATELAAEVLVLRCQSCGHEHFPRISPAVIVAVERGDELLLARSPHFQPGVYSVLAGFVDPGESLEECVVREVREEVGLDICGVEYFGSQPWPFPDSLMIGFTASYAGGILRPDPEEIEQAGWFTVEDLPPVSPTFSIARSLIDDWVIRHGGDITQLRSWEPEGV